MIEAEGLHKRFGTVAAVSGVSLRAPDGRITGLLGPNGAGKSTTLRILYTVLPPDSGDARIDGISVVGDPLEARRRMGVLPHGAGLYPNLTARENVLYFGALHGLARAEQRSRAAELIRQLEMEDFADRPGARASRRASGSRPPWRARSFIGRATSCSMSRPTASMSWRCGPCAHCCNSCAARATASSSPAT